MTQKGRLLSPPENDFWDHKTTSSCPNEHFKTSCNYRTYCSALHSSAAGKNWQSKIQLLFTLLGLTIDATAAHLAPSHQVEPVGPVIHSLVHKSHQKRQIRSGEIHNYDFHSERRNWLRMAIDRAKQSITVPPKTSNPYNRIRSGRQVPFVYYHLYILYFQGKRQEKYHFSRYTATFNKRSTTSRYKKPLS